MEFHIDGSVFDADLERTRTYYQSNTLCTCAYCRYYRENVRQRYPKLTELLERFGVDPARPDETEPYEQDGVIEYAAVHYTVSGSILAGSKKETRLEDTEALRLNFEPGGKGAEAYYPNEQEEPYFYITVWGREDPLRLGRRVCRQAELFCLSPRHLPPKNERCVSHSSPDPRRREAGGGNGP